MRWGRVILVTLAGVVSHTFGRSTMPLLLPAIAEDLELRATTAGATGSVNMAAYLCGVIAVTYLVLAFTFAFASLAAWNLGQSEKQNVAR